MKIKNMKGTTDNSCKCDSWLEHWKKFSRQSTTWCQAVGCTRQDLVGAHVQRGGSSTDQNWYIYPLCKGHNQEKGELEVADAYALVSANVNETCGK